MRAGANKHRIVIQQATESQSGSGALVTTWITFASRWAEIITSGGKEFVMAQALHGDLTHLVKIRGYCAVTSKMRVLLSDGRALEIIAAYSTDGRSPANAPEVNLACMEAM